MSIGIDIGMFRCYARKAWRRQLLLTISRWVRGAVARHSRLLYRHTNQVRAEMKRPSVLPDTAISESVEKVIVTVYSPQDYAAEA